MFSLEVVEGRQGLHRYFAGALTWGELDRLVTFPENLVRELDEDQEMQRSLARKRITDLVEYLREDDHFFSALTLIMLPRHLEHPVEDSSDFSFEPHQKDGFVAKTGTLRFSGSIRLFPADGQHRARAGIRALTTNPTLADECVPVVLLPYVNPDQVRQLFSDLNLNAKPVNKTIGYAFDSRDPISRMAKQLASDIPLFVGRVNRRTNSLPRSSTNVVTLNTLVEGTRSILEGLTKRMGSGDPRELLGEEHFDEVYQEVRDIWQTLIDAFPDWQWLMEGKVSAGDLRDRFVFPHGLGWLALTSLVGSLLQDGDGWREAFARTVTSIDWTRSSTDLKGLAVYDGKISNTRTSVKATTDFALAVYRRQAHRVERTLSPAS